MGAARAAPQQGMQLMDSLFKASLREDGDETMIERRGDANRLAPADEDVFAFGETGAIG